METDKDEFNIERKNQYGLRMSCRIQMSGPGILRPFQGASLFLGQFPALKRRAEVYCPFGAKSHAATSKLHGKLSRPSSLRFGAPWRWVRKAAELEFGIGKIFQERETRNPCSGTTSSLTLR
jgi:hypothetical protein